MSYKMTAIALALLLTAGIWATGCSLFGDRSDYEEPDYKVKQKEGPFEIRHYEGFIMAETLIDKKRYRDSGQVGFRRLAGYIFGKNDQKKKMAMTTPVFVEKKRQKKKDVWKMAFVMPSKYKMNQLPKPDSKKIKVTKFSPRKVAVVRYSGNMSEKKMEKWAQNLQKWLKSNGYKALSNPRGAAFDPPWTLPFLRRNEVHIDVKKIEK